jgi:hypothetical protein
MKRSVIISQVVIKCQTGAQKPTTDVVKILFLISQQLPDFSWVGN